VDLGLGNANRKMGAAVAVQPDGKIVLAGTSPSVAGGIDRIFALRLEPDGDLDPTFDGDGVAFITIGGLTDQGKALALQDDGKVVVVGQSYDGTQHDTAVVRFRADGSLDTSFQGGYVLEQANARLNLGMGLLVSEDGTITVGGGMQGAPDNEAVIYRYLADGTRDGAFDGDGLMSFEALPVDHDVVVGMVTDRQGRLVAAVSDTWMGATRAIVVRVDPIGALDASFGTAGIAIHEFETGDWNLAMDVVVQEDGGILVAGLTCSVPACTTSDGAILRMRESGTLDTGFGTSGVVTYPQGGYSAARGVEIQYDGMPIVYVARNGFNGGMYRLDTETVSDYVDASTDWDTPGTNLFGACLSSVASGATTDATAWTPSMGCPATDGIHWRPVPVSAAAAGAKVAMAPIGDVDAVANLRFGLRTLITQPSGTYVAPLTFDVIAPNA